MHPSIDPAVFDLLVWLGALFAVLPLGLYLVGKIRSKPANQQSVPNEMLSKFRELHGRGELTDAEYRTIKTRLAVQLQHELNDNAEKG